jgi:hypothetical protein
LQLVRRQTVCKLGDAEEDWGQTLHLFQNWTQYSSFSSCKSMFFLSGYSRVLCNIPNFRLFVFLTSCKQIEHRVTMFSQNFVPLLP